MSNVRKDVRKVKGMDSDVLGDFLDFECDGFQRIRVVKKTKEYAELKFYTWDGTAFRVRVTDIREDDFDDIWEDDLLGR